MSNDKGKPLDFNSARVQKVALKIFLRICRRWQLNDEQMKILLDVDDCFRLDDEYPQISRKTLERISYVFGVYKSLRIIFPTERQANAWIKKPNAAFDGNTALQIMLNDPSVVRRYLDAQVHS